MPEPSRAWSWFKVSVRVLTDPKVMKAARRAGTSVHGVLLWALSTNAAGGHEGEIPLSEWDAETVAVLIGCDGDGAEVSGADQAQRAFDELARSGFMVLDGESIMLPAWSKWRPESSSTDRVRAWRERQAAQKHDETLRNVTSVSVTQEERRGEESGEEEKRETTRARTRGVGQDQDHQLTDATRADLDADPKKSPPRSPPARTADTPEDPASVEARALAHAAAQQWQADRLAFAPRARECQPGEWSILEPDFSARLVPHALELSGELLPCLKWAMADVRSGPGFPGWRTVLRSPQKVLDSLRDGAMVEQWRAAITTDAAPIRREPRDPRRGTCYGATPEEIAADAAKYAGGRAR